MTLLVADEDHTVEGLDGARKVLGITEDEIERVFGDPLKAVESEHSVRDILEYVLDERGATYWFTRVEDYEPVFRVVRFKDEVERQ